MCYFCVFLYICHSLSVLLCKEYFQTEASLCVPLAPERVEAGVDDLLPDVRLGDQLQLRRANVNRTRDPVSTE